MKKKIFLVSALVLMAMGAMFVSCKKSTIENGCTCTMKDYVYGETETEFITGAEMKETADYLAKEGVVINTCSDYSDYVMKAMDGESAGYSITCK